MNVMQSLAEFKQNLHGAAHPPAKGASGLANSQSTAKSAAASPAASSSGSTVVTANEFLQLLVAELQNQDPTANQDPNAYIDQLVQVNSLQQLISINQDLNPSGAASSGGSGNAVAAGAPSARPSPASQQRATGAAASAALRRPTLGSAEGTPAATVAGALTPRLGPPPPSGTQPSEPLPGARRAGPRPVDGEPRNPALPWSSPLR